MYIVTFRELELNSSLWLEGAHLFKSKEDAVEFMAFTHELPDRYRDIRLWDASEIEYRAEIKATIILKD